MLFVIYRHCHKLGTARSWRSFYQLNALLLILRLSVFFHNFVVSNGRKSHVFVFGFGTNDVLWLFGPVLISFTMCASLEFAAVLLGSVFMAGSVAYYKTIIDNKLIVYIEFLRRLGCILRNFYINFNTSSCVLLTSKTLSISAHTIFL